jgi:hypothetical protein
MVPTMKMVDAKKGPSRGDMAPGVKVNRTGRRTYTESYKRDVVMTCLGNFERFIPGKWLVVKGQLGLDVAA